MTDSKNRRRVTIGLVVAWLALLGASGDSRADDLGAWTELSPMPFSNAELGTGVIGDRVYLVGGFSDMSALVIYDTVTDSWSRGADMPHGNHHPAAIGFGGKLYVIGGYTTESLVQVYDPATDSWTVTSDSRPKPRRASAVVRLGDEIHTIGGTDGPAGGGGLVEHDAYDPATAAWRTPASLLEPIDHGYAGVIDDKIYMAGGRFNFNPKTVLQIYDPTTDSWSYGAPMFTWASGHAVQVVDGLLYVFGGEHVLTGEVSDTSQRYDPRTDSWQAVAELPTPLHAMGSAVVGGSIYLFGGTSVVEPNSSGRSTVLRFDPPPPTTTLAPKKLKAKILSPVRLRLKWKFRHRKSDATGLELEIKTAGGAFGPFETLAPRTRKAFVTDLEPGETYTFRIRALGPRGPSAWSNERTVTMPE